LRINWLIVGMSSPSSHIGLAQLQSRAAKIHAHERAKPNAPRKPASRVLGAIAAEDHGDCRGLASQVPTESLRPVWLRRR
jgi:hypothetical protein